MIRLTITNDGTGTNELGNYEVELVLPKPGGGAWRIVSARVESFDRTRGFVELIRDAAGVVEKAEAEMPTRDRP